jgi:hypothetical protein
MATAPKRRWYQFSLKTLLVVVTALSIVLGLRIAYLRRQADFHAREAERIGHHAQYFDRNTLVWQGTEYSHHRRLADEYHSALHRPWSLIDENMRTDDFYMDVDGEGVPDVVLVQSHKPAP